MSASWIAVGASVAFVGCAGNVWLLMQEAGSAVSARRWNSRVLRVIAVLSAVVAAGTAVIARPWYWDLALGVVAAMSLVGTLTLLRRLSRGHLSRLKVGLTAGGAVSLGVVLLTLAGVAGVLDIAALGSADPVVQYHGGPVLRSVHLVNLFWGPGWTDNARAPRQVSAFDDWLPGSPWATAVIHSGFGVTAFATDGCWIDRTPLQRHVLIAKSIDAAMLQEEIAAVFTGTHHVASCPGTATSGELLLPADAVVALWLPPGAAFAISGVAEHAAIRVGGRLSLLPLALLPGSYAAWGEPGCAAEDACRSIPAYASPTYALSHEVLEAVTDPEQSGWFAPAPLSWTAKYVLDHGPPALFGVGARLAYPGEVADLCAPGSVVGGQRLLIGHIPNLPGANIAAFYRPGKGCTVG